LIVVVIVVLAVLVIAAIVWARVSAARSENKSVETYEHALGVLGEVAKRTESTGFRIVPHEETGRPHVGRRIDPAG
jgi:type II secretory pathway pseudopilin PulG